MRRERIPLFFRRKLNPLLFMISSPKRDFFYSDPFLGIFLFCCQAAGARRQNINLSGFGNSNDRFLREKSVWRVTISPSRGGVILALRKNYQFLIHLYELYIFHLIIVEKSVKLQTE